MQGTSFNRIFFFLGALWFVWRDQWTSVYHYCATNRNVGVLTAYVSQERGCLNCGAPEENDPERPTAPIDVEINSEKAKMRGLKLFNGTAVNITDSECKLFPSLNL